MTPAAENPMSPNRHFARLPVRVVSLLTAAAVTATAMVATWPRVAQAAKPSAPSRAMPEMITPQTLKSINMGLRYLERTQRHDGSWSNATGGYYSSFPVVMTSLAGLALMSNGSTPESGPYAKNVSRALNYVLNMAESNLVEGRELLIAGPMSGRSMYSHGFGMLFLAQCYGVEGDKTTDRAQRLRKVLEAAVKLTENSQSTIKENGLVGGGWIYTPEGRSDEGSVTVTQLQALRACRNVGIKVSKKVIDKAVAYLKICQQADGGICYSYRSRGSSRPAISAAAIACFYSAGVYDRQTGGAGVEAEMVERLVKYCRNNVSVEHHYGHYFYTHLYMAQAMYQRGDKDWKEYFPKIRNELLEQQFPDGSWQGDGVGEVYGTALACIILQLPYGYLPIVQR
jgi:hypothetical protein